MKPKRLFPGTPKVRRDQVDRMVTKLRQKGRTKAQALAAVVVMIEEQLGYRRPSPAERIRRLLAA